MCQLIAVTSLSLDGVMQAPGRPDEDRRGGFAHGGRAVPYNDEVMLGMMGKGMGRAGRLLQSLIRRNLVDRYLLLIHPLLLGSGRRLFPEGAFAALRLLDSVTTTTGVVIATYQANGATNG
jgi:hypothetical protein